jgi:hypothetical protein
MKQIPIKKKWSKHKQGVYHAKNKDKYSGTLPIVYRSSWECHLMRYLDNCSSCISWGSESAVVKYNCPVKHKLSRYYIDFTAVFQDKNGQRKKFYIEVKPHKQTVMPVKTKRKREQTFLKEQCTYAKNMAKWQAAIDWAKARSATFIIITEKELFRSK